MPQSLEGLQMFNEVIVIQRSTIIKETFLNSDKIMELKSNFKNCLQNALIKIYMIMKQTNEKIIFDQEASVKLRKIIKRYKQ